MKIADALLMNGTRLTHHHKWLVRNNDIEYTVYQKKRHYKIAKAVYSGPSEEEAVKALLSD